MKQKVYRTYLCAEKITQNMKAKEQERKIEAYRKKLTSALTFKDYDRFCTILTQMSNYTSTYFDFAYDLFEDFEGNKEIAYTFVNALGKKDSNQTMSKEKGEN